VAARQQDRRQDWARRGGGHVFGRVVAGCESKPAGLWSCRRDARGKVRLLGLAHRMASVAMAYSFPLAVGGDGEEGGGAGEDDEDGEDGEGEGKHCKAMVPLADLLNADVPSNCRFYRIATHLEIRMLVAISAGDQLFNDYGPSPAPTCYGGTATPRGTTQPTTWLRSQHRR